MKCSIGLMWRCKKCIFFAKAFTCYTTYVKKENKICYLLFLVFFSPIWSIWSPCFFALYLSIPLSLCFLRGPFLSEMKSFSEWMIKTVFHLLSIINLRSSLARDSWAFFKQKTSTTFAGFAPFTSLFSRYIPTYSIYLSVFLFYLYVTFWDRGSNFAGATSAFFTTTERRFP